MYRKLDIFFCGLMLFGALGHLFGTFKFYTQGTDLFVWSLSGAFAAFLLVGVNVVRIKLPHERIVSLISALGSITWLTIVALYAQVIRSYFDFRVLIHTLAAFGLLFFSIADLRTKTFKT